MLICIAQWDHSLEALKYSLTIIPNTIKYCGGTSAVSVARPFGAFGESVLRDFSAPTDNKKAQAQRELQRSASASEKWRVEPETRKESKRKAQTKESKHFKKRPHQVIPVICRNCGRTTCFVFFCVCACVCACQLDLISSCRDEHQHRSGDGTHCGTPQWQRVEYVS